jgi:hypothetical protein
MVGVFIATGIVLFFAHSLGITAWEQPLRPWLIVAFALSGAILATHVATLIPLGKNRFDLRLVPGNPLHQKWSIGAVGNIPTLNVMVAMNFAHDEQNLSAHIKRAYLKGTKEATTLVPEVVVDGPYGDQEVIHMSLLPIKAKSGRKLRSKVVFVDQFNGKHVSDKVTFTPQAVPASARGTQPLNCFFCHKPVEAGDTVPEAVVPAHAKCIWK